MTATLTQVLSSKPTELTSANPVLREWEALSWENDRREPRLRVERVENAFGPAEVTLVLTYTDRDGTAQEESHEWEYELNQWLVDKSVCAVDESNEKLRFAHSLRTPLQAPMTKVGDGFFNSVLVELVADAGQPNHPELADVLRHIRVPKPAQDGKGYLACRQWILITTERMMYDLQNHLKYTPERAASILVGALAIYLDHRFSVSHRRRLGLLS